MSKVIPDRPDDLQVLVLPLVHQPNAEGHRILDERVPAAATSFPSVQQLLHLFVISQVLFQGLAC